MTDRVQPAELVHRRLQGWTEREVCRCEDCVAWEVTSPPVWVPAAPERLDGVWTRMAKQLHGRALLVHRQTADDFATTLQGLKEREQFRSRR